MLLTWLIYFITDVYGHVALKMAGSSSGLAGTLFSVWGITAGVSWMVAGIAWTLVLSKNPLLSANTISALTYVFVDLAAILVFKEQVTPHKLVGILCVFVGIYLVNR
jgi:drug/metabolite transporter (DMT)-like permease